MEKPKVVKVTKIQVQMGETTVELTPDEARSLKAALDELLGKDKEVRREYIPWYPYPYYERTYTFPWGSTTSGTEITWDDHTTTGATTATLKLS